MSDNDHDGETIESELERQTRIRDLLLIEQANIQRRLESIDYVIMHLLFRRATEKGEQKP